MSPELIELLVRVQSGQTTCIRAAEIIEERESRISPNIDAAVNRFLAWKLPASFSPDCGISFDGRKDDEWNKNRQWPVGTNLFSAVEARQMLEHALASD